MKKLTTTAVIIAILVSGSSAYAMNQWNDTQKMQQKIEIETTGNIQNLINLPTLIPGESQTLTPENFSSFENALAITLRDGEKFLTINLENFSDIYSEYEFSLIVEESPNGSSVSIGTSYGISGSDEIPLVEAGRYVFSYRLEMTARNVSSSVVENVGIVYGIEKP